MCHHLIDKYKYHLACIGLSASSAMCIRWTARTAEALHAPWVAVYVENIDSDYLKDEERKTLSANTELAEKLGAEIVTLNGHDLATVIAEYAKLSGITNIVIGKSRNKKMFRNLFEMDLEDKLISLLPSIEVHIIPGNVSNRSYRKPKYKSWRRNFYLSWEDTFKTLGFIMVATLLINERNTGMVRSQ